VVLTDVLVLTVVVEVLVCVDEVVVVVVVLVGGQKKKKQVCADATGLVISIDASAAANVPPNTEANTPLRCLAPPPTSVARN
jgi:hypothetical protein